MNEKNHLLWKSGSNQSEPSRIHLLNFWPSSRSFFFQSCDQRSLCWRLWDSTNHRCWRRRQWHSHAPRCRRAALPTFLGGGNSKICLCSLLFGDDDSQFDEHIFQRGWFNHQPVFHESLRGFWTFVWEVHEIWTSNLFYLLCVFFHSKSDVPLLFLRKLIPQVVSDQNCVVAFLMRLKKRLFLKRYIYCIQTDRYFCTFEMRNWRFLKHKKNTWKTKRPAVAVRSFPSIWRGP